MKRQLIIATLGIASLGLNSLAMKPVFSQSNDKFWEYDCYLKSNGKVVGHTEVLDTDPNQKFATSSCNSDVSACYPNLCGARLREKPIPPMSLDILPNSSQ